MSPDLEPHLRAAGHFHVGTYIERRPAVPVGWTCCTCKVKMPSPMNLNLVKTASLRVVRSAMVTADSQPLPSMGHGAATHYSVC